MSEQKCRKVYVPVNLDVDAEGNIRPRLIRWIDGRVYEIDRLKHKCRAASTKVGGCGIRYTVMIGGHESFLYNEDFQGEKLERLLNECEIKPHVIQMEAHPYFIDTATMERLSECGCRVMAWYPLSHGDRALLEEPVFMKLAEKYGKSAAQIILRWHVQFGNQVIPGSNNPEHIRENLDIFDFCLTDEEMDDIAKINKNVRYYNATDEMVERYAGFVIDLDSQE